MSRYRLGADHSRFTVRAFATGLLSFMGHSPTFAVRNFTGTVEFEDDLIAKMKLALTVPADELAVSDDLKPSDRREIEERTRDSVLQSSAFPRITFRAVAAETEKIAQGRYSPVTALAGAIRLKDDVELKFDVVGVPEPS